MNEEQREKYKARYKSWRARNKDKVAAANKRYALKVRKPQVAKVPLTEEQQLERKRMYERKYRETHKASIKQFGHNWYSNNKASKRAKNLEWIANNGERNRSIRQKAGTKWRVNNPHIAIQYSEEYQNRRDRATPKWLSEIHIESIRQVYLERDRLNQLEGNKPSDSQYWTVDHVIPLAGDDVSGLHVPWNLQLLRRTNNSSKNNKLV
jgi:5-methylcytosine-specific restriction endonuclease McrA